MKSHGWALVASGMLLALLMAVESSGAQVPPAARWRTFSTTHFRIHFTPELETAARRAAVSAERAYAQLALELAPPRGPIDLVVADNVDFTNGLATPFPSNRIIVYAHPPVSVASLRLYDDWNALVITHELAHIFQLDRSGGWWRRAQTVLGRAPFLFPNAYAPSWLTEGLAIYYESRFSGVGRLVGTEHRALARASAAEGGLPWLHQLSLGSSDYPGGEAAYAYGALMIDYLARTRGPQGVRGLVDALSEQSIPFMLDRAARRGFGIGFAEAWREWRDSVGREAGPAGVGPLPGFRELTREGFFAAHPRWLDDSTLIYSANTGRDVPGAYRIGLDGRSRRVGRRNGLEPNVPVDGGGLLFAQLQYEGPYHLRSDLFIQWGSREERLTKGARLSSPDARADGLIVAVQAVPGTTRLVRVSSDGATILPLTPTSVDTQWAEPRWSPRGNRIAAVRHRRGAISEIVVLDTLGGPWRVVAGGRSVFATPSWSPDGSRLLFVSDSSGRAEVYDVPMLTESTVTPIRRLTSTVTTVFDPAVAPDGSMIALGLLRADGQHLGVAPYAAAPAADEPPATIPDAMLPDSIPMDSTGARNGVRLETGLALSGIPAIEPEVDPRAPARQYSPWRTLRPYYWLPVVQQNALDRWQFGGLTSGQDVVGRHSYFLQAHSELNGRGMDAYASYQYRGLGQPALDVAAERIHLAYDSPDVRVYSTTATGAATLDFPGTRESTWLQGGGELEWFRMSRPINVDPDARLHVHDVYRSVFVAGGVSNAKRPALSISPEDGLSASIVVRRRWGDVEGFERRQTFSAEWTEIVATASGYKSLDLPGFAHHVIAARGAVGYADQQPLSTFAVGGTSGSALPTIVGSSIGGARRTFPVRGFPVGAARGLRAATGSVEYRAPAVRGGRGFRLLPVFFDRSSVTVFGDAGSAWCPSELSTSPESNCGPGSTDIDWMASAGAELNLDAAVLAYDAIYRIRLGFAAPIADPLGRASEPVTGYLTLGLSF